MYNEDQTKHFKCWVSFDPAIDFAAMGAAFDTHFGRLGSDENARAGNRDPSLIKLVPGAQPCVFTLRPLTMAERLDCDAVVGAEHRIVRALCYALVKAELHAPLSTESVVVLARDAQMGFTMEMLAEIMERVGVEAIYEIGAVAYMRSKLGPFGVPFAPRLLTSEQRRVTLLLHRADTLARQKSDTRNKDGASTSSPPPVPLAPVPSAPPGNATAPESDAAPPEATTPEAS